MAKMTLGADRKGLIRLGIVLAVLAAVVYYQFFRAPAGSTPPQAVTVPAAASAPSAQQPAAARKKTAGAFRRGERFRPTMRRSESEAPPDPRSVDPTLRIDLLAGVRGVAFEAVERDIFNFGVRKAPPPPPTEEEAKMAQQRLNEQIKKQQESQQSETEPAKPDKPSMPRLSWKYYGLAGKPGTVLKRGFLLDGEEILIGAEGEVFEERYKIKRINLDSIVIEDLTFEQEQTLSLAGPS